MAAAAGPMLSTLAATHVQAPYSTSSAPSMADSLPTLDFKFDELRATMNSFTRRFDAFIEQGRRRVLDERNQFKMRVAEMGGTSISTSTLLLFLLPPSRMKTDKSSRPTPPNRPRNRHSHQHLRDPRNNARIPNHRNRSNAHRNQQPDNPTRKKSIHAQFPAQHTHNRKITHSNETRVPQIATELLEPPSARQRPGTGVLGESSGIKDREYGRGQSDSVCV